jgi:hypothetical protein
MLRPDPKDRTQNGMKLGVALRDHAADDLARLRRREEILGKMRWNHPGLEELTEIERELAEIERWTCPAWMPYASRFALGSAALHTGPGRASATRALEYAREAMRLHPHEPRLDLLFDDAYQALVETGGSGTTVLGAGRGEILADRLEHLLVSLDSFNTYTTQERVRAVMGELANLGDRAGAEHPHRDLLHRARRLLDSIENHAAHELRALHDQLMDRW